MNEQYPSEPPVEEYNHLDRIKDLEAQVAELRKALENSERHVREHKRLVIECVRRGEAGKPLHFDKLRDYIQRHPPSLLREVPAAATEEASRDTGS